MTSPFGDPLFLFIFQVRATRPYNGAGDGRRNAELTQKRRAGAGG
jgi:hypothetical protein